MEIETLDADPASKADRAKRRQIMEGARAAFISAGFDGASMNDVARVAGVSKGTLYAYFDSKEDLFEAIIRAEMGQQAERLCDFATDIGDARAALFDFGVRLIVKITQPDTLALARIVIAAAGKFPQLGRAFYEEGPAYGAARLARVLRAVDETGALSIRDAERAAWQFIDLCQAGVYKRVLFGMVETPTREEIEAAVAAAVEVFLAAYGAK